MHSFLKEDVVRRLVDRLGEAPAARMHEIDDEFALTFSLGLRPESSVDICLALLWRAHRGSISRSIRNIVDELAPELDEWRRGELANRLDIRRDQILEAAATMLRNTPGSVVDRSRPGLIWGSDAHFGALLREVLQLLPDRHAHAR